MTLETHVSEADDTGGNVALLLMDFHCSIVAWHGEAGQRAVHAASKALAHARTRNFAVFHVVPSHREYYPEMCAGRPFDDIRVAGLFRDPPPNRGIAAELTPRANEPVVAKVRYSPFFANDLLLMLSIRRIHSVVLVGLATSGVVLSAIRDAWDRDFKITVLADGCADHDPETHRLLLNQIFPAQATVSIVSSWINSS